LEARIKNDITYSIFKIQNSRFKQMALFDFLKRKKEVEKAKEKIKKEPEKGADKALVAKPKKVVESDAEKHENKKNVKGFSYSIVKEPHISEKSTLLAEGNKYTFKVDGNANKPEIKRSVEGIYGVNVLGVSIIKIPKKKRRLGKTEGFRKGYRKAVVTIKKGQKIEVF